MISKKEKIKNFAKDLFLKVNEEGNKIHTWDSISKAIQKKFNFEIHYSTIAKWAVKDDWNNTFEKIKMVGIERGKEMLQEKENKVIDEKANAIADIYKSNRNIQKLTQQTILSRLTGQQLKDKDGNLIKSDIYTADLVRLLQHSEQTILNLHDKKIDNKVIDLSQLSPEELISMAESAKILEKK